MLDNKNITWDELEKLKIENKNISVVVYRDDNSDSLQATAYTGDIPMKKLEVLYSEKEMRGVVVFKHKNFIDYINGNPKNRTPKIPNDFVENVVSKFFSEFQE